MPVFFLTKGTERQESPVFRLVYQAFFYHTFGGGGGEEGLAKMMTIKTKPQHKQLGTELYLAGRECKRNGGMERKKIASCPGPSHLQQQFFSAEHWLELSCTGRHAFPH